MMPIVTIHRTAVTIHFVKGSVLNIQQNKNSICSYLETLKAKLPQCQDSEDYEKEKMVKFAHEVFSSISNRYEICKNQDDACFVKLYFNKGEGKAVKDQMKTMRDYARLAWSEEDIIVLSTYQTFLLAGFSEKYHLSCLPGFNETMKALEDLANPKAAAISFYLKSLKTNHPQYENLKNYDAEKARDIAHEVFSTISKNYEIYTKSEGKYQIKFKFNDGEKKSIRRAITAFQISLRKQKSPDRNTIVFKFSY
jgi:hypothetical protein